MDLRRFCLALLIVTFACSVREQPARAADTTFIQDERITMFRPINDKLHLVGRLDLIAQQPKYTQIRPALLYRWRALELGLGYGVVSYYASDPGGPADEHRFIVRARLTQRTLCCAHYEQLAVTYRRYPEGNEPTSAPSVALRYGQGFWIGRRALGTRIQRFLCYEEVGAKLTGGPQFDYLRLWGMYDFPVGANRLAVGLRFVQSRVGIDQPPNFTYGPQVQWTIGL